MLVFIINISLFAGFVQHLPENSNRVYQALYTANEIVNTVVIDDRETYQKYVVFNLTVLKVIIVFIVIIILIAIKFV